VPYFLVTFTVPEALRPWLRSRPKLGYDLLFDASSQALQDLAGNPRRLGASLACSACCTPGAGPWSIIRTCITWCRGGGLSPDRRQWIPSRADFLLPVLPLSDASATCSGRSWSESPGTGRRNPGAVWKATLGGSQCPSRFRRKRPPVPQPVRVQDRHRGSATHASARRTSALAVSRQ